MDTLRQDLRQALRSLRHNPALAAACILCVALGIAANVFVWSPFNSLVIRPLPYPDSGRLMQLSAWQMNSERRPGSSFSYPDYDDMARAAAERGTVFSALGAYASRQWNVGGIDEPERVSGARVTASVFPMLGLRPTLGRFFHPDEDLNGKVAVLSHGLWQRKFGGDSSVIGRTLRVNGDLYTIVGVMQEGIRFPDLEDLWLPIEPGALRDRRDAHYLHVAGRLSRGATVAQANDWVAAFMRPLEAKYPDSNRGWSAWVQPMQEEIAGEVRKIFLVMIGAVSFVLLIACANVANLLLARGSAREREIAVRAAMGASRGRLIRQLLTESVVLAMAGGIVGVLLGSWSLDLFMATNAPSTMSYWIKFDIDRTVLLVSVALTLGTGLIFGLAPALQLASTSVGESLKAAGGRSGSGSSRMGRLRSSLVVVQLTLSLVLLVGATLMIRSFLATQEADLGFRPRGVLTLDLALAGERYANDTAYRAMLATLESEIAVVPGVKSVGLISSMPVKDCCQSVSYFPEGKEYPLSDGPSALIYAASPGAFDAIGFALLEGRPILASDGPLADRVAVVDEVFARREWPNESAVGRRLKLNPRDSLWTTVVGVMRHVVPHKLSENRETAEVVLPLAQHAARSLATVVRTDREPSWLVTPLQEAVKRIDRDLPLAHIEPMKRTVWDRMFEARIYGIMFTAFGIAALVLAGIGLYGVVSYAVTQRTHEMGIRMALGAGRRTIVRLVLGGSARLVGIGIGIGVPAAFGLAQLLRGTLYGVRTTDIPTFLGIPSFLVLVSLAASFVPARRASRVDPAVALRNN